MATYADNTGTFNVGASEHAVRIMVFKVATAEGLGSSDPPTTGQIWPR